MNFGSMVSLPGGAFKCLFEVHGHECKARSLSIVVDFSPDSSAIGGKAGSTRAGFLQESVIEKKSVTEQRV